MILTTLTIHVSVHSPYTCRYTQHKRVGTLTCFNRYSPNLVCLRTLFAPVRHSPTNNLCITPLIFEHRKFYGNSFKILFKYFTFVFKNVRRDIFGPYTFIMYICLYINCLLYVHSFSLISNMSIILI